MTLLWYFFFYSFVGWCLDTLLRSLSARKFQSGAALKPLPLCIVYGFGALLLLCSHPVLSALPLVLEVIAYGLLLGAFEYLSGLVSERVFRRRLWGYGSQRGRLRGYTDAWHVVLWGFIALFFLYIFHPWIVSVFGRLTS